MREIKFRGKRIDNGEWVYGYYVVEDGETYIATDFDLAFTDGKHILDFIKVIPETVGQYTGLKDENGVEIYEGDVVFIKGEDNKGTVVWDLEELEYGLDMENVQVKLGCFYGRDLEVIGNIHDNPELLESTL